MINLNNKYAPIVQNNTRYYSVIGGRSSGKSYSVTTILCLMLLEDDNKILFLRKTLTSAHLSIIPEFIDKLNTLNVSSLFHITKTEIVHKTNGSAIYFRGVQSSSGDNTANLKSLNGISTVVFEEFEEITDEATFDRIDLSVRSKDKVNKIICVMNPTTKSHFWYTRMFESQGVSDNFNGVKDNCTYIHTTYLDNLENINESFIEQANIMKERKPEKYKNILLGSWLNVAEGVIFENWEIGEFVDTGYILHGADFGFSIDPNTLVKVSVDSKNMRLYAKELLYKSKLTTDDLAGIYLHHCGRYKQIIADSAEPRLIDELKSKGLNIKPAIKGQGSILAGIAKINNYRLIVDPSSINFHKELNNYVWSDKASGRPVDKYNHLIDSLRYSVSELIEPAPRLSGGFASIYGL